MVRRRKKQKEEKDAAVMLIREEAGIRSFSHHVCNSLFSFLCLDSLNGLIPISFSSSFLPSSSWWLTSVSRHGYCCSCWPNKWPNCYFCATERNATCTKQQQWTTSHKTYSHTCIPAHHTRPSVIISSKFSKKLRFVHNLAELRDLLPLEESLIPPPVKQ